MPRSKRKQQIAGLAAVGLSVLGLAAACVAIVWLLGFTGCAGEVARRASDDTGYATDDGSGLAYGGDAGGSSAFGEGTGNAPGTGDGGGSGGNTDSGVVTGNGTGVAVAGTDGIIDLTTSECFNKPANRIRKIPHGTYTWPHIIKGAHGMTYDFRGTFTHGNPPKHAVIFDDPHDVCVVGLTVQGQQSRKLTWDQMKHGGQQGREYENDGISWNNPTGTFIIEGAWIDNFEDGIGPPFDYVPDHSTTYSLRHVYAEYIRDDFLEDDGCLGGELIDSLIDGTHVFVSQRPSKGTPITGKARPLVIKDSLIRMSCKPDPRTDKQGTCPKGTSTGIIWKWGSCGGKVNMSDSIFMLDACRPGKNSWPPGTYKNVTLIWGDSGSYPGKAPPAGVTVTKDKTIWTQARAAWLARHGCDSSGKSCSFLDHDRMSPPAPQPTVPVVQVITNPTFMDNGRGTSVMWSGHNVTGCSGQGTDFTVSGSYGFWQVWAPAGAHTFTVTCSGPGGETISDSDRAFWFTAAGDTQKPSVPTGLAALGSPGRIELSWDASTDNIVVAAYRVYRDGQRITVVSGGEAYTDRDVQPGVSHTYQVAAWDAFGNLSDRSNPVSATAQ